MQVIWQSEIEPYCCDVLKKHWPGVPNLGDIFKIKDPPPVDLICGGFPCQPFSVAGKRKGKADDRYIWPEMLRVITEVKPRWVFAENVPGILHMELDQVLSDLERQGYETGTLIIPACALNAPHRRDRIWIVGYSKCRGRTRFRAVGEIQKGAYPDSYGSNRHAPHPKHDRCDGKEVCLPTGGSQQAPIDPSGTDRHAPDTGKPGLEIRSGDQNRRRAIWEEGQAITPNDWDIPWPEVATRLCRISDGLPAWVHRHRVARLKALGNAIVPQIAEEIGRMIMVVEQGVLGLKAEGK